MKKILLWLIGLIILIFLCVWTKLDSIYSNMNNSNQDSTAKNKVVDDSQALADAKKRKAEEALALAEKQKAEEALAQKTKEDALAEKIKAAQELAKKRKAELFAQLSDLDNVQYGVGKAELTDEMKAYIDSISDKIIGCEGYIINIFGYTDSDGSTAQNQILGQQRAQSVKQRFISGGIDEKHLVTKSFGELSPIMPNTSDINKQLNRRVEIKITGE